MSPESNNPEPLRNWVREWSVTEPLPPRFQEGVWRRIQKAELRERSATTAPMWAWFRSLLTFVLPRPSWAVAYLSVVLAAGIVAGYWQARQTTTLLENALGTRYVQSVDPYQKRPGI